MPQPARPGVSHVSGGCYVCTDLVFVRERGGFVMHIRQVLPFDDMANSSSLRPDVSRL